TKQNSAGLRADRHTAQPANDRMGQLLLPGPRQESPIEQWNDTLAKGFASGCGPNMDGREEIPRGTPTKSSTTSLGSFVSMDEPSAFRGQNRERFLREPDARKAPVRFDQREEEPEPCQADLRRQGESTVTATGRLQPLRHVLDSTH